MAQIMKKNDALNGVNDVSGLPGGENVALPAGWDPTDAAGIAQFHLLM